MQLVFIYKNGPNPAYFCLFSFFSNPNFTEKTVGVSGIRTRIVGIGEHADHHLCPMLLMFMGYHHGCKVVMGHRHLKTVLLHRSQGMTTVLFAREMMSFARPKNITLMSFLKRPSLLWKLVTGFTRNDCPTSGKSSWPNLKLSKIFKFKKLGYFMQQIKRVLYKKVKL